MPNQWVRVVKHTRPKNVGRVVPVEPGRPYETLHGLSDTGEIIISPSPAYAILPGKHSLLTWGPFVRDDDAFGVLQSDVELLGPDECARLDAEHGMDGTEGEG